MIFLIILLSALSGLSCYLYFEVNKLKNMVAELEKQMIDIAISDKKDRNTIWSYLHLQTSYNNMTNSRFTSIANILGIDLKTKDNE